MAPRRRRWEWCLPTSARLRVVGRAVRAARPSSRAGEGGASSASSALMSTLDSGSTSELGAVAGVQGPAVDAAGHDAIGAVRPDAVDSACHHAAGRCSVRYLRRSPSPCSGGALRDAAGGVRRPARCSRRARGGEREHGSCPPPWVAGAPRVASGVPWKLPVTLGRRRSAGCIRRARGRGRCLLS